MSFPIRLVLGFILIATGLFVWFEWVSAPGAVDPPPAQPTILVDCVWLREAVAWLDVNGDGTRERGELPLGGVRFFVDSNIHARRDIGDSAVTDARGKTKLRVWLPGCPDVKFTVYAQGPPGYSLTTPSRVQGDGPFSFGFKRTRG